MKGYKFIEGINTSEKHTRQKSKFEIPVRTCISKESGKTRNSRKKLFQLTKEDKSIERMNIREMGIHKYCSR
jgi:hypothetical protein